MKSQLHLTTIVTLVLIILSSCQKDDILDETALQNNINEQTTTKQGELKLGKKLENPYSVENMQKAYDNLKSKGKLGQKSSAIIKTTHYYVRFLPKDELELHTLKLDTNLEFYEYPLDYEIEEGGIHYHDPSLPENSITWQYTVVDVNYNFPSIKYEKLANLFLGNENDNLKTEKISSILYEELEEESLNLTGNTQDLISTEGKNESHSKSSKWNPKGYIRVYDDLKKTNIPVDGVVVRARRWFTTKRTNTNASGYFKISHKFKRPVNYSLVWETSKFDIRNGNIGQANFNGPKKKGDWNLTISSGESKFRAHIFRAAIDYFYNHSVHNLTSPPIQTASRPKLKIAACYKKNQKINGQCHPYTRLFGVLPSIKIFNPNRSSHFIYQTTIHEIGHYAHWGFDKSGYNRGDELRVAESWAKGVAWVFTNWRYLDYESDNHVVRSNNPKNDKIFKTYTSVVRCLIDNNNERNNMTLQYLGTIPSGTNPFIYGSQGNGNLYYTPLPGNQCTMIGSSFDGANCYVRYAPNGTIPVIDGNRLFLKFGGNTNLPLDEVSGYTINQVEQALKGSYTFAIWENKLRTKFSNPTEKYLDELFGSWN